ncbi:hypothetical protein D8674_042665 [Pyrus ussuriensis x Pyrus communis]|uniref:Microtubule-associated protein futsch-like n=1 Tax=Pyrus ussuriensis x Pyrus communis TaxID=2448454 RepID=A0A5N5I3G8_9ROSA|nr:hypothetical protein D8674_042665 [Pyrus ussuriensis x Pyrus communis]
MGIGAEAVLVCVWRFVKFSMKTSSLCVQKHPFISATLFFCYLFYVFFNLFVFWFPFLVCIAVLVRLFYSSGGLTFVEEVKRDEKPSSNDRVPCVKPDQPVGGGDVVNRDGSSFTRQKSRRTNVSRRCIEAGAQDYYNVGKHISISKTLNGGLIGGTALIDRSKKAVVEEKAKCGFDQGESSAAKASAEESIQALVEQHHSVLDSDISESQLLSSDDSDEQPGKLEGDGTNRGEAQESGNKAVQWTDDDQRNLMDLGLSEIERNKRLESLIARRKARKLFKMQVEKGLIDLDTIIPGQIAPILISKNNPVDYTKLVSSDLDTPGSAPSILLPMQNPFDLPYDPHEEKPNLMADSFQQEFTAVHQKEMLFCRHESFSLGAASYPLEPKRKSLDGLGCSRFKKQLEIGPHDRHIERMLSGKHDEVIEALLSKARENMSDIGNGADTAESRTESPLPATSSVEPKDEGNRETQRVIDTTATNKKENKSVEMQPHVTDDSNDESSSTSYSEDDEQSFHFARPGPSQNAGSKLRRIPPKPLDCSIPKSKSAKEPLHDSSPSAHERSRLEERLFYSERGTCHTPTYSIASDLQVEVSEVGSPPLTDGANSPTDRESVTLDGDFEKEYMWAASSQSSKTEESESKPRDVRGLSEKDLASIRFSGNNKNSKDAAESSSMQPDELDDVCSLSSSITEIYGDGQAHSLSYNGKSYDDVRQAVEKVGKLNASSSCNVLSLENQDETMKSNEQRVAHPSAKLEELNPPDETTKKVNTPATNETDSLKDEKMNAGRDGGDQILVKQDIVGEPSKAKEGTISVSSRHLEGNSANTAEREASLYTKHPTKDNKNSNRIEGDLQQETENDDKKELDVKINSNPTQGRKDEQGTVERGVSGDPIASAMQKDLVIEDVAVASTSSSSSLSSPTSVLLEDISRDQASSSNYNPERLMGAPESEVGGNVKSDSSTVKPHDSILLTPQTAMQPGQESTSDRSNTSDSKKLQKQCMPPEKSTEEANIILTEQAEEIGDLSQKVREATSELKKQAEEIGKVSEKAKEAAAELKKPAEETGILSQKATEEATLDLKKSDEKIGSASQKAREVVAEMKKPTEEIVNVSQKATEAAAELIKPAEAIKDISEKATKVDADLKQPVEVTSNVSQKATKAATQSKIPVEEVEDVSAKPIKVDADINKPVEQIGNISQKTTEAALELKKLSDEIGSVSTKEARATAEVKKPAQEIGSVSQKATEVPVQLKIPPEEVGSISQKASDAPAKLKHSTDEIISVSQKASEVPSELKKPAEEIGSVSQKSSQTTKESKELAEKIENVRGKKIEAVAELKKPAEEIGNVSMGATAELEKPVEKVRSESQRATEGTAELKIFGEEVGSASQKETKDRAISNKSSEEIQSGSQKMTEALEKIKNPIEEIGNVLQQATMTGLELILPTKETGNPPQKTSMVAAESKKSAENVENMLGKTTEDSTELKKPPEEVRSVSQTETDASTKMKETAEETGSVPLKATEAAAEMKKPAEETGSVSTKATKVPVELKRQTEEIAGASQKAAEIPGELKRPAEEIRIGSEKSIEFAAELKKPAKENEAVPQKVVEIPRQLKRPAEEKGIGSEKSMESAAELKKSTKESEATSQKAVEILRELKRPTEEKEIGSQKSIESAAELKKPAKESEAASQKTAEISRELKRPAEEIGMGSEKSIESATELKKPAKETKDASQKTSDPATNLNKQDKGSEDTSQKASEPGAVLKKTTEESGNVSQKATGVSSGGKTDNVAHNTTDGAIEVKKPIEEIVNVSTKATEVAPELKKPTTEATAELKKQVEEIKT